PRPSPPPTRCSATSTTASDRRPAPLEPAMTLPFRLATVLAVPAALLLGGCLAAGDVRPYPAMAPFVPVIPAPATTTAGAINDGRQGMSLYGDRIARDVGDLLTITLVESTTAQTSASTQVGKDSQMSVGVTSLFGAPVTYNGREILSAAANGERDFDGQGKSSQSNRLQ